MTTNILLIVLLLAIIYLLLAPRFAAWLYRHMLFHPEPLLNHEEVPEIEGIKGESVNIKQPDGHILHAWFFQYPNARYTMLVSHGNRGNIATHDYLTAALLKHGVSVFMYDYCGYGASSGLPNLATVTGNGEAAYDYLVNDRHVDPQTLILYGESLGAAVSAHLATVRKVRALIFQSGFSSLRTIAREKIPLIGLYPKLFFPRTHLDPIKSFKTIDVPVLIVHGLQDMLVPFHHAQAVFAAAGEPKQLVSFEKGAHRDCISAEADRFNDALQEFLRTITVADQN